MPTLKEMNRDMWGCGPTPPHIPASFLAVAFFGSLLGV
jgi:hypothetical protein